MKQYIGISESNLYGNWKVFSPENILMFRCGNSKAKFYLKKNLAIQLDDTSIQLTFEPKGLGHHEEIYGLQNMYNQCVCCGSTENLTKHHIIPYCYRHYFPTSLKEHTSHDVVMLCGNIIKDMKNMLIHSKRDYLNNIMYHYKDIIH